VRAAARWLPDGEESGHSERGGGDSGEHGQIRVAAARARGVRPPKQIPADQDGENQVADQQWLYHRETPEAERHHLQRESHDVGADGGHPQRLAHQIEQDPGRQCFFGFDPLRAALVRDRRYPEKQRGREGGPYGDRRGQRLSPPYHRPDLGTDLHPVAPKGTTPR
jgi:hypothetical protein